MAGSWLKIETSTPQKIEVLRIAQELGVSRREAFAMCFEFWSWCDLELTDGSITGLSLEALDEAARLPAGFAAALLKSGWLCLNGENFTVANFTRHLGQTAKTRADGARRAAKCADKKRSTRKRIQPS